MRVRRRVGNDEQRTRAMLVIIIVLCSSNKQACISRTGSVLTLIRSDVIVALDACTQAPYQ